MAERGINMANKYAGTQTEKIITSERVRASAELKNFFITYLRLFFA